MKARLALVAALALPLGLSAMPTAVEYLPSKISLKQSVKLGDGSVLPAGSYDVQIHYKGFGNSAEFWFFTGGVFKGKTNAEARGFPSQAPAGVAGDGIKGESADHKHKDQIAYNEQKADDAALAIKKQETFQKADAMEKWHPASSPQASFSWGMHGFAPGSAGKTTISGNGVLIKFDSSNSAAGFSALVPAVQKK